MKHVRRLSLFLSVISIVTYGVCSGDSQVRSGDGQAEAGVRSIEQVCRLMLDTAVRSGRAGNNQVPMTLMEMLEEILKAIQERDVLKQRVKEMQDTYTKVTADIADRDAKIKEMQETYSKATADLAEHDAKIKAMEQAYLAIVHTVDQERVRNQAQELEKQKLQAQLADTQRSCEQSERRIRDLSEQCSALNNQCSVLNNQCECVKTEVSKREAEVEHLKKNLSTIITSYKQVVTQAKEAQHNYTTTKQALDTTAQQLQEEQRRSKEEGLLRSQLEQEKKTLQQQVESSRVICEALVQREHEHHEKFCQCFKDLETVFSKQKLEQ